MSEQEKHIQTLYDHRNHLYIALLSVIYKGSEYLDWEVPTIWKSMTHSDGHYDPDWFLVGIATAPGEQMSYHLPIKHWDDLEFVQTLDIAPEWDGHSSEDVIERLRFFLFNQK